jgi:hypothetical protein
MGLVNGGFSVEPVKKAFQLPNLTRRRELKNYGNLLIIITYNNPI